MAPTAAWCWRCYAPRSPGGPLPDGPDEATVEAPAGSPGAPSPPAPGAPAPAPPGWPCGVCEARNPLGLDACEVCGTPFGRGLEEPRRATDPRRAALWSMAFPGVGHLVCDRGAEGFARAVLFAWAAGAAAVVLPLARVLGLVPLGALFVVVAAVLYGLSAVDAYRVAGGRDQVLSPRALLYGASALAALSALSVGVALVRAGRMA